ncbi:MAG: hypothetical protein QM518_05445 [Verrucomicrobiota bacterium]|nr:hypothetical protein [Verrucomicrobiota bacterium]
MRQRICRRTFWCWCPITTVFLGLISSAILFAIPGEQGGLRIPSIGCWFWHDREFEPEGYRMFVDAVAPTARFDLLTASLRVAKREITDPEVHDQFAAAVAYAATRGVGIVLDLDIRLARAAFAKEYPEELQEMLRMREVRLQDSGTVMLEIASESRSDHYTGAATPYIPVAGRLIRVYSYRRIGDAIDPASLEEVSSAGYRVTQADASRVQVELACSGATRERYACMMVGFSHWAVDVFAPHLLPFQRRIIQQYSDLPLAGAWKDEWGFPPDFTGCPDKNDYWFSNAMADAYAERTGGRDLVADLVLLWSPQAGRETERLAAINHYQEMCRDRNALVEADFYDAVKAVWGPDTFVGTHPTWWPHPDRREFKKNGLDWWAVRRDWAQTDEHTPFSVRTALSKKCTGPVWFNMFYASALADYERELWSAVLGGGRVNYHPYYPERPADVGPSRMPLDPDLIKGEQRVRLLNGITRAQLDCPVAVLFGDTCAMNWAGPAYDDVGLAITDVLWAHGYPADLIPLSELHAGALRIDEAGRVRYGAQAYQAVVVYHPEFERPGLRDFLHRAAAGDTALYRVGDWTAGFDGRPIDLQTELFAARMAAADDAKTCAELVLDHLRNSGIEPQTPASAVIGWDAQQHRAPGRHGMARLIDGTHVFVAAEESAAGDRLKVDHVVGGHRVRADATGLFAFRLGADGGLEAVAASGLTRLQIDDRVLEFDPPIDCAEQRMDGVELEVVRKGSSSK